jgi:uncharacterized repeat protein (TIGR03806 family)
MRRRKGLVWLYLLAVGAVLAAGVWYYLERQARKRAKRPANDTIELPLAPPTSAAWGAVNAFPRLKFAEPVLVLPMHGKADRLVVLERCGRVQVIDNDPSCAAKSLLLDISSQVSSTADGDNGALGLALHPQFGQADSPHRGELFVIYTARDGGSLYNRLSRFTLADGQTRIDPASEAVLVDQLDENEWHDGGSLLFGPDGFLYLGMGDEGWAEDYYENGQKIDRDLFSGVLRIDVDCVGGSLSHAPPRQPATGKTAHYFIPNDNPFVGVRGALEEFWALGLRNPYRMAFDPATGKLWAGDVGQNLREQVCLVERGSNHGWSYREGSVPFDKSYLKGKRPNPLHGVETRPVFEYPHVNGNNCIIGGQVYRGKQFPELEGKYIYGDNVSGRVWALDYDLTENKVRSNVELMDLPVSSKSGLSSFGNDADGELLLCVLGTHQGNDGTILRLVKHEPGKSSTLPRLLSQTGVFADLATLEPAEGVYPYEVNSPLWSDGAYKLRWIMIPGDGNDPEHEHDRIGFSASGAWTFPVGTVLVKHFELALDESRPDVRKRLETRLLVCDNSGGLYGCTYKWNDAGDDAELVEGSLKEELVIQQAGGQTRVQTWHYPSQADCLACHTQNAGYVLGVKTSQLNRTVERDRGTENQLAYFQRRHLFHSFPEAASFDELPRLVAVDDTHAPLETRVRSYLDANCSSCHRPGGIRATFDARFETPLEEQGMIGAMLQKDFGNVGAKIVLPRKIAKSMLVQRMLDAEHRMPPLGTAVRDMAAIAALCEWIDSLPADPASLDAAPHVAPEAALAP